MYGKIFLNGCFRVLYDNMTEDLQQKWRFEEFEQLAKKGNGPLSRRYCRNTKV